MEPKRPAEELYNILNDPFETNNLADNPEYTNTLAEMRFFLDSWLTEADKGTYPEDPEEIAYWDSVMTERFKRNMARRELSPEISDEEFLEFWIHYMKPTQKNPYLNYPD